MRSCNDHVVDRLRADALGINTRGPAPRHRRRQHARIAHRLILLATCLWAALLWPLPASAQERGGSGPAVVAVLPLSTGDARVQIYSAPVANALAKHLHDRLASSGTPAMRVQVKAISLEGAVPSRVALVVDGRIVVKAGSQVLLEAHVRDPARGARLATVATGARGLREIDMLTRELGDELAPLVTAALKGRQEQERGLGRSAAERTTGDAAGRTPVPGPRPEPQPELRPAEESTRSPSGPPMVVFTPGGKVASGAVPVDEVARRAAYRLAHTLGYRPVSADRRGILDAASAARVIQQNQARYGLMIQVERVEFVWRKVLTARGTVRVVVITSSGDTLYDETHRTDTVVGSRGDRHVAVLGFAMSQSMDMARPELLRRLRRDKAASPAR